MAVIGCPQQPVAGKGQSLYDHHVGIRFRRNAIPECPVAAPCRGIERDDLTVLHRIEHAVDDERGALHLVEISRAPHPLQREILRVVTRDLVQQAVSLARIAPAVGQPVLRLLLSRQAPIEGTTCHARYAGVVARSGQARGALCTRQRAEIRHDIGDIGFLQHIAVRRHQPVLDNRGLAHAPLEIRLELLPGSHHLDAEGVLVEKLAGDRRSIRCDDAHKAVLG